MASIKKKNGKWEVRYDVGFDSLGKRIQKYKGGFARQRDAEDFLITVQYSINNNAYIEPDKLFMYEYLNKWLEGEKDRLSPTTYSGYKINIRCHIIPYIGGLRLQDIKTIHLKDLYSRLSKDRIVKIEGEEREMKKLSPKSITYVHRVLSKSLEDAYKDEIIPRNPAKLVSPPSVPKHKANFLDISQIKDMLVKFKDDEFYMVVYLSVVLGLRRGEVLGLRWQDIDLEKGIVSIRNEYVMVDGKALLLEDTKTKDSKRDIVVTERIIALLREHRKKQKEMRLKLGNKYIISDFVCTWDDGKLFNPSHVSRAFKLRMKKYSLPEIKFHELRHSNASMMISSNVNMKGASDRLGHSTITITNDLYGHIETSVQKQIAETIDHVLWGVSE